MKKSVTLAIALACLLGGAGALGMGCSVTTTSTNNTDDAGTTTDSGKSDAKKPDGGGTEDAGSDAPATGDEACKNTANQGACIDCCVQNHPQGNDFFNQAFIACYCADDTKGCKTVCANSLCAATPTDPQTGDACDQCLGNTQKAQACGTEIRGKCNTNADCKALLVCVNNTGADCFNKPE